MNRESIPREHCAEVSAEIKNTFIEGHKKCCYNYLSVFHRRLSGVKAGAYDLVVVDKNGFSGNWRRGISRPTFLIAGRVILPWLEIFTIEGPFQNPSCWSR